MRLILDGTIRLWSLKDADAHRICIRNDGIIRSCLSPDQNTLLFSTRNHAVVIVDQLHLPLPQADGRVLESEEELITLTGTSSGVMVIDEGFLDSNGTALAHAVYFGAEGLTLRVADDIVRDYNRIEVLLETDIMETYSIEHAPLSSCSSNLMLLRGRTLDEEHEKSSLVDVARPNEFVDCIREDLRANLGDRPIAASCKQDGLDGLKWSVGASGRSIERGLRWNSNRYVAQIFEGDLQVTRMHLVCFAFCGLLLV
jgi:hypothetical protein